MRDWLQETKEILNEEKKVNMYMMLFPFSKRLWKKVSMNTLSFTQLSICGMPSFLQNISNCYIYWFVCLLICHQSNWFPIPLLFLHYGCHLKHKIIYCLMVNKIKLLFFTNDYFPPWKQNLYVLILPCLAKLQKTKNVHITFPKAF